MQGTALRSSQDTFLTSLELLILKAFCQVSSEASELMMDIAKTCLWLTLDVSVEQDSERHGKL